MELLTDLVMRNIAITKRATLTGHNDCVYSVIAGIEDWQIISSAGDGMVVSWDLRDPENGVLLAQVKNSVYALCIIPGTKFLAVGHNFEGVHIIDLETKKQVASVKVSGAAIFDLKSDGRNLWVADGDGTVYRYHVKSLKLQTSKKFADKSARSLSKIGNTIAIGLSDWSVRVVDAITLEELTSLKGHKNSVFTVAYSPEGEFLYTAGRDASIKTWSVSADYKLLNDVPAHMYAINDLAFSPDGQFFATGSMDKSLKIWSVADQKLLKVVDKERHAGHGTSINKVHWSSFNNQIVTCSDDRTLSVWEITL